MVACIKYVEDIKGFAVSAWIIDNAEEEVDLSSNKLVEHNLFQSLFMDYSKEFDNNYDFGNNY